MEEQEFRQRELKKLYRSLQENTDALAESEDRINSDAAVKRARDIIENAEKSLELSGNTCDAIRAEIKALAQKFYEDYDENAVSGVVASRYEVVEILRDDTLIDYLIVADREDLLKRTLRINKSQFNQDYREILELIPDTDLFRVVSKIKVSISGI